MRAERYEHVLKRLGEIGLIVFLVFAFGGFADPAPAQPSVIDATSSLQTAHDTNRSLNWSGYVAEQGEFTEVSGTWVVPKVEAGDSLAADATWVGIGGVRNRNLIQAGTQAIVDGDGGIEYQAWIEELPGESQEVPLAVKPGDVVSVEVAERSPGSWRISIHNNSTGKNYEATVAYDSVHASAEWIEEMPSASAFIPLDKFDRVDFIDAHAVMDGARVTPQEAGALPVSMVNEYGETLAVPTVLAQSGSAFRVDRNDTPIAERHGHFLEDMSRPAE